MSSIVQQSPTSANESEYLVDIVRGVRIIARMETRWSDTTTGGVIMRTGRNSWLARPYDRVGMNHIRPFTNRTDAVNYADKKDV